LNDGKVPFITLLDKEWNKGMVDISALEN